MRIFHVFVFLTFIIATSLAAPASNNTITTYVPLGVKVKYAPEPRGRGTLGIIFTCMTTFFFCVWTTVHPDIVADTSTWCRLYYRSILMLIAALVPEGLMVCAFIQRREAGRLLHDLAKGPKVLQGPLGMDGAFFVVMGGFVVVQTESGENAEGTSSPSTRSNPAQPPVETQPPPGAQSPPGAQPPRGAQSPPGVQPSPGAQSPPGALLAPPTMGKKFTLTSKGFEHYLKDGTIKGASLDNCKKSIVDRGKTSNIAKVIAGGQALWLFLRCLSRWIAGLPLTLLEVHVMIQVVCTVVTYACWWSKPLDVNEPIEIAVYLPDTPDEGLAKPLLDWSRKGRTRMETSSAISAKAFYDIAMCLAGKESWGKNTMIMFVEGVLTLVTGALHAAAWRFHFPSIVETWFWRGSSLGMCFFPMVLVFITVFTEYQKDVVAVTLKMQYGKRRPFRLIWVSLLEMHYAAQRHARKCKLDSRLLSGDKHSPACDKHYRWSFPKHIILVWSCLSCVFAYILCITFITVEAFLSMRDQPEEVFLTPGWTDYLPFL